MIWLRSKRKEEKMKTKENTMFLSMQMKSRCENLELMKFLAAISVIIHHSFDLTLNSKEWLKVITGYQFDFGTMAVSFFFFASGIFVAKSVERCCTFKKFFKARLIRLWPPLFAVVLLSVIMGACVTSLPLKSYLLHVTTWKYFLNAVFVLCHELPGVFENNVYNSTVNGALWTLPVEVLCYIACFVIYKLKLLKEKRILSVLLLFLLCVVGVSYVFPFWSEGLLSAALRPCYFFLLGHAIYVYREKIVLDIRLFFVAFFGLVICFALSRPNLAVWVFFPYILLYLAFMKKQCGKMLAFLGRYSYTIYLCAFPIQQLLIHLCGGNMNTYQNMLLSIISAVCMGMILHHGVEKPIVSITSRKLNRE
jgi:peptidoglycan/LPS O-acetylase OafA/YrhL